MRLTMVKRSTLLFITFVLAGCLHRPHSTYARFSDAEFGGRFSGFVKSPTEHIIVETKDPIVLREVHGVLHPPGGDGSEWREGFEVVFEIRGPSPSSTIRSVLADRRGRFRLRDAPV